MVPVIPKTMEEEKDAVEIEGTTKGRDAVCYYPQSTRDVPMTYPSYLRFLWTSKQSRQVKKRGRRKMPLR